jgi:hypothetical protein
MTRKLYTYIALGLLALVTFIGLFSVTATPAHAVMVISRAYVAPRVYVAPRPVYIAPRPVIVARPVVPIYTPRPVIVARPPVIVAAPIVAPQPVYMDQGVQGVQGVQGTVVASSHYGTGEIVLYTFLLFLVIVLLGSGVWFWNPWGYWAPVSYFDVGFGGYDVVDYGVDAVVYE